MTTKDEVRSTVEALIVALEALEETRNALAWFYDSYPQDVTKKGNELLPHVETVLTTIRAALASKSEALAEDSSGTEQPAISAGMTLRDCFAAKALPSILSPNPVTGQYALVTDFDDCAITAYKMADSMLKARAT